MIEIRKLIVFLFVAVLFCYIVSRTFYDLKRYKFKESFSYAVILGLGLIAVGSYLDLVSNLSNSRLYIGKQVCFTVGVIIFITGIVLWDNYFRRTVTILNKIAHTDSMTGAYNRAGLEQAFESIVKASEIFYVMEFDLDRTKVINDNFGHISGDKYIINAAKIITEEIGINGLLARIGGDEFVALLDNTDEEEIEKIIVSIKKRVSNIFGDKKTSISIGCSMYGSEGDTLEKLLKSADKRMYEDKKIEATI